MNISVLGGDGYCGWATALYLSKQGHSVSIVDSFIRRQWDFELGVQTLTPIAPLPERLRVWKRLTERDIRVYWGTSPTTSSLPRSLKRSNRTRWSISRSSARRLTP